MRRNKKRRRWPFGIEYAARTMREKDVTPIHAGEEEKMQSLDSLVYQIPERSVNKTAHSDLDSLFSPIFSLFKVNSNINPPKNYEN